ncbi:NUDIX domain-containing protein [Sulfolobus sp. E5-1-F]|uniref:NUDIX hydrolase n=1 Tax=Sulfolobaceae TaxID=118883 RepID=UPI001295F6B3|nr:MULTISPECIES: CoA pyrophosphatase [unclassified Sulfolobus]QGA55230.1 NUDIX domain-containing protein [Sulfolobus sp. E5-1-F]QGA68022.1 NUDIX domain-containing protein [Sulfolobus sp. E11-6]
MNISKLLQLPLIDDNESDAAVVVLIAKGQYIMLIKRITNPKDPWSGQMALPGGHRENNESTLKAAIRECEEEVGIRPNIRASLGVFSPNNAKIKVRAYIAFLDELIEPRPNPVEIDKAFWVHESEFVRGDNAFYYKQYRIWGMTYRILSKLFEIVELKI